jgi:molecular chaperone Hsp33
MTALHKFVFDGLPVRGMLVQLTDCWQALLARRSGDAAFAPPVRALVGEMSAAGVLMHANLKFDGALVLQVHGDGPVKLAVVEVQPDLAFRSTAKVEGEVAAGAGLEALLNVHGRGRCAITLDPKGRQRGRQPYQGIVPLADERHEPLRDVSEVLEHYMRQSEQLETRFVLAADERVAAGLLIQRLPVAGGKNPGGADDEASSEGFHRIAELAGTLTPRELLGLPAERILHRLFWQEPLRLFEPLVPRFACSCSRERVRAMLVALGRAECEELIAERGIVEVRCEFCGAPYRFDAVDIAGLDAPGRDRPPSSPALQ